MYVEKFLEKNPDLFQPSVEAQEHGWPYLPENKDHIIEYLKKLMCQQEINWRNNNNNYVKNGFPWNYPNPRTRTHQLQAEPELKKPATSKKVPRPKSKEDEDESHNITVHLEYIFPLDLDASSSSTWLIEPIEYDKMAGKKIIVAENVDPFVLRYLHDRDLYDANDRNAIEDFARDVSRQYPLTALNLEEVITRCTEMVKEFATAWSPKARSLTTTPQLSTSRQSQSMSHPSPRLPHAHTSQRGQAIAHKTLGPPHATPYQYPGSSLSRENLPHYPIPRENASRSPAPPPIFDEPKKVQLFFTVEDRFGDLDDKNAFSQKNMFGMDLTTLFNTVSHSANKRLLELTDISFRCRWTPPRTFVLNRDDGEDKWKRTKDKLQDNFDIAKDRFRQRTSFEIWVLCGDMKKEALEATEDGLN
ncbi:hypothetical protein BJ875DRAFT_384062 [Amylocarpus encephaloides]|uniref:Uncharacterized protein n=1 Tax=Amylocarpus encephaloides TaxID=45428 RepID=A0A9P7YBP0_9HELO|nr:hypothetical protein BJ875DRAFT_384062 [Amylocarpus encephaloides]